MAIIDFILCWNNIYAYKRLIYTKVCKRKNEKVFLIAQLNKFIKWGFGWLLGKNYLESINSSISFP